MKKLRLIRSVLVRGRDIFGRRASIYFEPLERQGWWWKLPDGVLLPITYRLLSHNQTFGFLSLRYLGYCLHIWEHIGVLRFTGFDGVAISTGRKWPPYHGSAGALWNALLPSIEPTEQNVEWCHLMYGRKWSYPYPREGYLKIELAVRNELRITVHSDYPKVGGGEFNFALPDDLPSLPVILQAASQGWPLWRYPICKFLSFFGWPHIDKFIWPQKQKNVTRLFMRHRMCDLLGALSTFDHIRLLACDVESIQAGHEADLEILRQVQIAEPISNPWYLPSRS